MKGEQNFKPLRESFIVYSIVVKTRSVKATDIRHSWCAREENVDAMYFYAYTVYII